MPLGYHGARASAATGHLQGMFEGACGICPEGGLSITLLLHDGGSFLHDGYSLLAVEYLTPGFAASMTTCLTVRKERGHLLMCRFVASSFLTNFLSYLPCQLMGMFKQKARRHG